MVHHSSILLGLLLCVTSSYSSKIVQVNVICQKAKNPSFCSTLLNSKPGGAKGADLATLAQYTIDVLHVKLTNTVKLINTLISRSGKDVKALTHYKNCLKYYFADGGAIFVLGNIQRVLKEGNYNLMSVGANDIMHDISDCINDPNYHDTSSLPNYGQVALQIDQIIQIIAGFLMSK
ncbi:putative pectinesterase inhibitor domain-containing protein [Medicago truncatula]|uniref:Putative pectinesterase inhibitor domain-containing protein n=1 Tax=Medicago truncatula TaxID=3880 RepID=A0A396HDF5_MEDTR|nr:putative pectinesterase inhibitor domain-containing protein [Medicago truncatula]